MCSTKIDLVLIDGEPMPYSIVPGLKNSYICIETNKTGRFTIKVVHAKGDKPRLEYTNFAFTGNQLLFQVNSGEIIDVVDVCNTLENIEIINNKIYTTAKNSLGHHTLFIRVKDNEFDAFLPADYQILEKDTEHKICKNNNFEPINISEFFNCNMLDLHQQRFVSPRPEGYSIGVFLNGRYAWEWNHGGHNKLCVDDSFLRSAEGKILTSSGIPFLTPSKNENLACVSIWDNFPTEISIPLKGTAKEIAVLFISTTNAMQTGVENAKFTVEYVNGDTENVSLVYPTNIDDWLVPALQKENEYFYFNDYNHATIQRISVNPEKNLSCLKIKAVANEVILGVLGVSINK
jgi:hypothetical protein